MSRVKLHAKFQNLNFKQFFKICNFDFVLFWLGLWCESLVCVIMWRWGVSQNEGVLVVLFASGNSLSPVWYQNITWTSVGWPIVNWTLKKQILLKFELSYKNLFGKSAISFRPKGTFTHAGAGGKLASTQIITCVHTCAVADQRRSGSKIRSTRNGSNTQFAACASKPRAPNHHCPQEMADPPASAPRPLHVCVNIPTVAERECQNPPAASAPQPPRTCMIVGLDWITSEMLNI